MKLVENFLNLFKSNDDKGHYVEIKNNEPAKVPAIVPLEEIELDEIIVQTQALEKWLNSCGGGISLKKLSTGQPIKMTANIFALLGAFIDLLTVIEHPKSNAKQYKQQIAYLTINLIGLIPQNKDKAPALMALRPILATYAGSVFLNPDHGVTKADYIKFQQHLNDKLAGDLQLFVERACVECTNMIEASAQLAFELISDLDIRIHNPASLANINVPKLSASAKSQILRDPNVIIENWSEVLSQLLQIKTKKPVKTPELRLSSGLATKLKLQSNKIKQDILSQKNREEALSVAWMLETLKKDIYVIKAMVEAHTGVPLTVSGEYKGNVSGGTLEYMSVQPDAINNPICDCPNSRTPHKINFALGTERVRHQDFIIYGQYPLQLVRQYTSQLQEMDDSEFGARWSCLYTQTLLIESDQLKLITESGRIQYYPLLDVGQQVIDHEFGLILERISESLFTIQYGEEVLESYELIAPMTYRLVMQAYIKVGLTLGLRYDQKRQNGMLGLSHILLKSDDKTLIKLQALYNTKGLIDKIVDITALNNEKILAQYQYDRFNNLIMATNENGHKRSYQYNNEYHQLTRYTDLTGRGQNLRYESTAADAKAIEEWADDGSFRTRLVWDQNIRKVSVFDAHNVPTDYYYDLDGFTYRVVYADGLSEWTNRNQNKQIIKQTERSGAQTLSQYNDQGLATTVTDANQAIVQMQYDENALMVAMKDSEGGLWRNEYNESQQLIANIDPLQRKTQYQYNTAGQMSSVIDAKGGKKQLEYNALGQMTQFTDCSGKTTQWQYDERGRLLKVTGALGNSTQYIYATEGQSKGQVYQIIHADGRLEQFEYDAEGRLLNVGNGKTINTIYTYNNSGLITSRTTLGNRLGYEWDLRGQLKKLINANGREYSFSYDNMGRLIHEKAFDGTEKSFAYDAKTGLLAKIQTADISSYFNYDAKGNVTQRWFEDQNGVILDGVIFNYNSRGQLLRASNPQSQIDYYYDAAGQLIREHQQYNIMEQQHIAIWQYEYDALGNLESTIRPDGQVVTHLIYGSGHVYGVAVNQQELVGFERNDLHQESKRFYGNGLEQSLRIDKMGRLNSQTLQFDFSQQTAHQLTSHIQYFETQRNYQYGQDGLLNTIQDQRRGVLRYEYDDLGRLTRAQSSQGDERFAFDPAGNILDPMTGDEVVNHPNQLTAKMHLSQDAPQHLNTEIKVSPLLAKVMDDLVKDYAGAKYIYDVHGNVTERHLNGQRLKLNWNALNQLQSSECNNIQTTYGYDVFGRRLYKHCQYLSGFTTDFNQQEQLRLKQIQLEQEGKLGLTLYGWQGENLAWESYVGVMQAHSSQVKKPYTLHYLYEPESFVPLVQLRYNSVFPLLERPDYDALIAEGYDIDKDPVWTHDVQQLRPALENIAYYHCDQLGTPQELTDRNAQLLWSANYKAWGEAKIQLSAAGVAQDVRNQHRYQGQYYDEETGLHYNRFRYYDPHMARYVSRDPIGLQGGLNNSVYVPDPNQWIDPLGLAKNQYIYYENGQKIGYASADESYKYPNRTYIVFDPYDSEEDRQVLISQKQQKIKLQQQLNTSSQYQNNSGYKNRTEVQNSTNQFPDPKQAYQQVISDTDKLHRRLKAEQEGTVMGQLNKRANEINKYVNEYTGNNTTEGVIVTTSLKAGVGADITAGLVNSRTQDNKLKKCAVVSFCPSAGPVVQATGGIHKVFSAGEYNNSLSASACVTGTLAVGGGVSAANCTTFYDSSGMRKNLGFKNGRELFDVTNQTTSLGGVVGAAAGVNAAICPQLTLCTVPK